MAKIWFYLLTSSLFLLSPSSALAGWSNDDIGIQKVNQESVPHVNLQGQIQHSFNENSFFPLILYFTDMGKIGQPWSKFNLDNTRSRDTLPEVVQAGFNTSWPSSFTPNDTELNYAQKYGIKIIANLSDEISKLLNNYTPANINAFKSTIARLRDHKVVIGYHLYDEFPPYSDEQYLEIKNLIRTVDPSKIVFANHYEQGCTNLYDDISNFDVYPFKSNSPTITLTQTGQAIDTTLSSGCPRPVWVIIQAFRDNNHKWRLPTPTEMRGQIYTAIVHGATGIYTFMQHSPWAWNGNKSGQGYLQDTEYMSGISPQVNSELWQTISNINREITSHQEIFLSRTSTDLYHAYKSTKGSVHSLLKETSSPNIRYLLAVNTSAIPTSEKYVFSSKLNRVTSVYDNRLITPVKSEFTDKMEGYGVRLYKIEYLATTGPTPTSTPLGSQSFRVSDPNRDNKINILDYSFFVTQFGKSGAPHFTTADINGDGKVNLLDYNLFMADYNK